MIDLEKLKELSLSYNKLWNNIRSNHKYSIINGFINGVCPDIIGSRFNLEVLTISENSIKNYRNSISLEQLMVKYNGS